MTKTMKEIEAQVVADAHKFDLSPTRPTQVERLDAACRHAEKRVQELRQAIADNRSANYMNEQFPHDYAVSIMKHLSEIALDLRSRKGSD
jgi:hypothetical protein